MQNRKRDTDVQNRILDSVGEGKGWVFRENNIETCILSRVKQITSPGWMPETSARGWCTGKTQRDQVEREVRGGSGWGTHVNPWLIHFSVWQKPLQYCKVISLQLIKINGGKKKPWGGNWGSHSSVCLYLILLLVLSSIPLVAYNIKKNNFTVAYEIEILIIEIRWESQSIMSPYALLSS